MDFPRIGQFTKLAVALGMFVGLSSMSGCEVGQFLIDPSKAAYMQHTATETPILTRLDVVEPAGDKWGETSPVTSADLLPSDLQYRLAAGDIVSVEIFELLEGRTLWTATRQVDQSGNVRLPPPLRDFPAADLTLAEFEDSIIQFLIDSETIVDPLVTVNLAGQGQGFTYTIMGSVQAQGVYPLSRPDLTLSQALVRAQGVPASTKNIYVIRPVALSPDISEPFRRDAVPTPNLNNGNGNNGTDIEELIDDLPGGNDNNTDDVMDGNSSGSTQWDAPIDIDDFTPSKEATRVADLPSNIESVVRANAAVSPSGGGSYTYLVDRDEWVRTNAQDGNGDIASDVLQGEALFVERVIKIPYEDLLSDLSYDIVIRPDDRIFVEPPTFGVVYLEGEVVRPGVFNMPTTGDLTLSRLIAAAGGFNAIAVPSRVDLIRRVGPDREATVRVNLAAIRHKNEPDIFLKPDDHIIVGTNFWASPLAVIRNGFRATYGFGFLLDRNFGNDVFGAPPTNNNFGN